MTRAVAGLFLATICLFIPAAAFGQQTNTSEPVALQLATQAFSKLTNSTAVTDVSINATVSYFAGSDQETGTATFAGLGTQQSRVVLQLQSGQRTDVRGVTSDGAPGGYWESADLVQHPISSHNTSTDAVWFCPVLGKLATLSDPTLRVTYVGQETRNGSRVQHLRFIRSAGQDSTAVAWRQRLSRTDLYLDSTSLLPFSLAFNTHPDNDAGADIPVEIRFANYQNVNGVLIPFRIQRLFNGTLLLDATVTSAAINSGLSQAAFSTH